VTAIGVAVATTLVKRMVSRSVPPVRQEAAR